MPRETPCQDYLLLVECGSYYTESCCKKAKCLCTVRLFKMDHIGLQKPDVHLWALASEIFEYREHLR